MGTERCRISTSHVVAEANEPGLFLFCCILCRLLLVVFSFLSVCFCSSDLSCTTTVDLAVVLHYLGHYKN